MEKVEYHSNTKIVVIHKNEINMNLYSVEKKGSWRECFSDSLCFENNKQNKI